MLKRINLETELCGTDQIAKNNFVGGHTDIMGTFFVDSPD